MLTLDYCALGQFVPMKTERLYYHDSHTTFFEASIIEHLQVHDRPAVILDSTYFYPTGGGQPHDTGTINEVVVVDVFTRPDDLAVVHVLAAPLKPGDDRAICQLDWSRRFDHMQQHTGQHILTQAFIQSAGINTVGFHLSADTLTIDLDRLNISPQVVEQAEKLANEMVFKDLVVNVSIVDPATVGGDVRKRGTPDNIATDGLRIVEIGDFDRTACGGTHVDSTGEIGLIKVVKLEKRGDKTRIEFRCGGRALADYGLKNEITNQLTAALSCGLPEMTQAVAKQSDQIRELQRQLKDAKTRLLEFEAAKLSAQAEVKSDRRVVRLITTDYDLNDLRILAKQIVAAPGVYVLFGIPGDKANLLIARSADIDMNLNPALQAALKVFSGRGGGTPDMVQGGGVPATADQLESAFAAAEGVLFI